MAASAFPPNSYDVPILKRNISGPVCTSQNDIHDIVVELRSELLDYYNKYREKYHKDIHCAEPADTTKPQKNNFEFNIPVGSFCPNDIAVKVVERFIVITAKYEERQSSAVTWTSHYLTVKCEVPENCDPEDVKCRLSANRKILNIFVPEKPIKKSKGERTVPIIFMSNAATKDTEEANKGEPNAKSTKQ